MAIPAFFCGLGETHQCAALFPMRLHTLCVDVERPSAYIGGGPRLPNEALSFWKE
jgi:hypothetical protein